VRGMLLHTCILHLQKAHCLPCLFQGQ
jgi:hypothetical protein